jgi:hypothetical protein
MKKIVMFSSTDDDMGWDISKQFNDWMKRADIPPQIISYNVTSVTQPHTSTIRSSCVLTIEYEI